MPGEPAAVNPTQPPPAPLRRVPATESVWDRLNQLATQSAAYLVLLLAASLVLVLVLQGWSVLSKPAQFPLLTSTDWNPDQGRYGALVFVYGTLVTSLLAMLIAVPLGVGAAAYLAELAPPRLARTFGFLLELLAAIPSVVFGFWAREFLAKQGLAPLYDWLGLANVAAGQGLLAASIVLAVMILPYITAVSYDVCRSVPRSQREGSLAVGATTWQTIWHVVLPYARPGIVTACFLALGRALGETMAVTMVVGNSPYLDFRLNGIGDTIPSVIAKELFEASGDSKSALMALAVILVGISIVMNIAARRLVRRGGPTPRSVRSKPWPHPQPLPRPAPLDPQTIAAATARAQRNDRWMQRLLLLLQLATVVPLFLILGYITVRGLPGINWDFFTKLPNDPSGSKGLKHAFVGSAILVGLATAFAVPLGILTAMYLSEARQSRLANSVRFVSELLGGVPSIVLGIFGYAVLVYPVWARQSYGFSAWAGAFALGVMMLPVIIRTSEEAMRLVPHALREASYALGATRRQTLWRVVLPAALPAIITGIILSVARIAGETAPLILTARGSFFMPRSLDAATPSVPFYIYEFSKYAPGSPEIQLAWSAALVLVVVVLFLNITVRAISGPRSVAAASAA